MLRLSQRDYSIPQPQGTLSEEEALIAGPTSRPNEHVSTMPNQRAVPHAVFQSIPALIEASKDPNCPPAVKALLRLADYHINR